MYLMSEAYQDFLKGVTDSARTLFSRKKCEQFFGQTIQVRKREEGGGGRETRQGARKVFIVGLFAR